MLESFKKQVFAALIIVVFAVFSVSAQVNFPYGSSYKFLKGTDAVSLGTDWVNTDFDDSAWETGTAPFRYGDGTGGTELLDMRGNYSTLFLRATFTASQVDLIENIAVTADWDDGFVLFINGTELIRRQAPSVISYDALASDLHEFNYPEKITLSLNDFTLNEGENTLAVFACNNSIETSSDFFIDVNLLAAVVQPDLPETVDSVGVSFSKPSGFYYATFNLTITSPDPTAQVVYTLDGSNPQSSITSIKGSSTAEVVIDPNSKANRGATPGVVVRASIVKNGFKPAKPNTRTFIFLENVKTQTYPGGEWPSSNVQGNVDEQRIDYDIDEDVINSAEYGPLIEDAFLDIPSVSIITDNANLFDPQTGIYVNALLQGSEWERECSVELINTDGTKGFNINAGLRIRGGWSRHGGYPKHAFRLFFRSEYGAGKLNYPLFGDEGVDRFDKVDFRCAQNYGWNNSSGEHNTFIREVFCRDAQGETGNPYTRSRYYHLYLNGMYWGLFQTQERADARYAGDYLGGKNDDWDILKIGGWDNKDIVATDGNLDKWREVWNITEQGLSGNENYFRLEGKDKNGNPMKNSEILVEIDNLIDYMINIFYSGNFDSPVSIWGNNNSPNNLYIIKDRTNKTEGFQFLVHDAEHTMMLDPGTGNSNTVGIEENRVNLGYRNDEFRMYNPGFNKFHTQWLHHQLSANKEYQVRFADKAAKRLSNGGMFTKQANIDRLNKRADMIDKAIIAESARWGDTRSGNAYTKADWEMELNVLRNNYFPRRARIVINQLLEYDLYPAVNTPVVTLNGNEILEDLTKINSTVTLGFNADGGEIYYTVDGTDPRLIGGDLSAKAVKIESGETIDVSSSMVIKARALEANKWSGLKEVNLITDQHDFAKFKVTELHYHPTDSIIGTDTIGGEDYEFIEFKNTGSFKAINLSGVVIDSAINFTFPENTLLAPQQYYIVAAKPKKFYARYGMLAMGNSKNSFSNGGERVMVIDKFGDVIMDFRYFDEEPWPTAADGDGSSLVAVENNPTGDPNEYFYWTASRTMHGSPKFNDLISSVDDGAIADDVSNSFMLYPNPTSNNFKLSYKGNNNAEFAVKLYDVKGTLIYAETYYSQANVSLNDLNIDYGVYMLNIESNNQVETRKLVYTPR